MPVVGFPHRGKRLCERQEESRLMNITHQTIHIQSAIAVNVGDHGVQHSRAAVRLLLDQIESSTGSAEEKAEAKSRLQSFLAHPLVAAVVSGAASAG